MANFFVVVSQLKDHGRIVREKSGRLWATNFSKAEIEAGKYRETLNWTDQVEWIGQDFYIVMAVKERDVKQMKGYTKWWNNRVTEKQ